MFSPFFTRGLWAAALLIPSLAGAQLVRQANTTLALPANLPSPTGYAISNAIGSQTFSSPMCTTFPAGETNRLYVAQRAGLVRVVNSLSTTPTVAAFMNLGTYLTNLGTPIPTDGENGLLSMAFHPNYNQNGFFYLYYSITSGGQSYQRLARFQATGSPGSYNAATSANPNTQTPLLTMYDEAPNHNGGTLAFGADGYLYLSLGDEGGGNDQFNNARFINKHFWGKVLRLDVDNKAANLTPNAHTQSGAIDYPSAVHAGTYKVPADNPFIGFTSWHGLAIAANTVRTEIWATGLRNPFRYTFDPPTGRMFLGDVGQNIYEEVDIIVKGGDYGWSWREGLHDFVGEPAPTSPPAGYDTFRKDPIYEYDHTNDGNGNDAVIYGATVCGGLVYRGNQLTELQGKYLFADYGNGIIAALTETSPGVWAAQRLTPASSARIVHFGVDPRNNEPLLTSLADGIIYRIARSGTTGTNPPNLLSQTGAFSNLSTLTPQPGIVPYDTNVSFWSDYAVKSRWFCIKNTTDMIGFNADGNWTFPQGMVWVKHFDFDLVRGNPATRRRLETRFLVKTATDVYGLTYRWNNIASGNQTDATLVAEEGLTETVPGSNPAQEWRYPSRGECRTCHTSIAGFALGFNTRQLNRSKDYDLVTQNQIAALCGSSGNPGYFSNPPTSVPTLPAFANATDTSQSLEWRVRSYLAVNCAQCHQPGGVVQATWDARPTIPTDSANLINGLLVSNGGDTAARWAVPGDAPAFGQATHSMVLRRVRGDGAARMPPLATSERNLEAETLLSSWIAQELPTRQSFAQWQVAQFGSTTAVGSGAGEDPDGDGQSNYLEFLRHTNPHAASPLLVSTPGTSAGNFQLSFTQPANCALLIETSVNLQTWSLWNVPGNAPIYPASNQARTLVGSARDVPARFFRARITAP